MGDVQANTGCCVPRSLLSLHDAVMERGLDGRHIQAWLDFEHEALRWGFSSEIERNDLEALIEASEMTLESQVQIVAVELDATGDTR